MADLLTRWASAGSANGSGARSRAAALPSDTGGFAGDPGKPHLPDGVVVSTDDHGRQWCTAVEVKLTRKTEARVVAILRHLLSTYDDVVCRRVGRRGR